VVVVVVVAEPPDPPVLDPPDAPPEPPAFVAEPPDPPESLPPVFAVLVALPPHAARRRPSAGTARWHDIGLGVRIFEENGFRVSIVDSLSSFLHTPRPPPPIGDSL
jgi:hypothetical protein